MQCGKYYGWTGQRQGHEGQKRGRWANHRTIRKRKTLGGQLGTGYQDPVSPAAERARGRPRASSTRAHWGHGGEDISRLQKTCTENCNPPEPCKKIREALCLPAGDTTQRCRRTGPDAAAIATATWGVPRARARTRRGRAWEHACAARLGRSSRRAQREAVPEILTEFACLEGY